MMRLSARFSLLMFVAGCLCLPAQGQDSLADLGWLAGGWEGNIGKAHIEEHWISPAGGTMLGISRTIANARTVAFEFLRIETRPDGAFYVAQPQGRPPVEFRQTRRSENQVVFENPQHDHPKIIRYSKEADGSLRAEVEGDEKGKHQKQEFRFLHIAKP
ncbi:MAG: DUF6265 family protein [Acidobacteria bacterium]|nr:DUF6265 family protein [Acidobacteriota bacterium]